MVLVDSSRRRRSSSRSRGGSSGSSNHIDDTFAGNAVVTMIIIMIIAKITITAKSIMLKISISHNDIDKWRCTTCFATGRSRKVLQRPLRTETCLGCPQSHVALDSVESASDSGSETQTTLTSQLGPDSQPNTQLPAASSPPAQPPAAAGHEDAGFQACGEAANIHS